MADLQRIEVPATTTQEYSFKIQPGELWYIVRGALPMTDSDPVPRIWQVNKSSQVGLIPVFAYLLPQASIHLSMLSLTANLLRVPLPSGPLDSRWIMSDFQPADNDLYRVWIGVALRGMR